MKLLLTASSLIDQTVLAIALFSKGTGRSEKSIHGLLHWETGSPETGLEPTQNQPLLPVEHLQLESLQ